eukprot:CAMPEP_0116140394 /NCGR_PEP_ID=MMETSP0329-20121206/13820_1 /TAXON_ID=697910 /ORGANISM="Pseudo-nitzschia arenysensis, Strain B593" /LENGTH=116 /DNA_ID=CAMNT_0003635497 /DNA_START=33 /DNA_END=383 /DNA_ORIENTATION=+
MKIQTLCIIAAAISPLADAKIRGAEQGEVIRDLAIGAEYDDDFFTMDDLVDDLVANVTEAEAVAEAEEVAEAEAVEIEPGIKPKKEKSPKSPKGPKNGKDYVKLTKSGKSGKSAKS